MCEDERVPACWSQGEAIIVRWITAQWLASQLAKHLPLYPQSLSLAHVHTTFHSCTQIRTTDSYCSVICSRTPNAGHQAFHFWTRISENVDEKLSNP